MEQLSGIGKTGRERLGAILRATRGTISVDEAAMILAVSNSNAAKMLSRWAQKGWLTRLRRGIYMPVPLESRTPQVPLEDPWIAAERLFAPCYIGGWSAAEFLDLTEQIFNTVIVMTAQAPRDRRPTIKGTPFWLRTVRDRAFYGLKPVWRGQVKVLVSDASRTIVDMLADPSLGGGIRPVYDMLTAYLGSKNKAISLLMDYAAIHGNGAVFKRLGFLLEIMAPQETSAIAQCRDNLTAGNSKLDPKLKRDKLITRWRLWIPKSWVNERSAEG